MMDENKKTQPDPRYNEIEAGLRNLPQPAIPKGLEDKLLAAIPAQIGIKAGRRSRFRWYYTSFAAALAAGLVMAFLFQFSINPQSTPSSDPGLLNNTNPQYILNPAIQMPLEETKTCYVLPSK